MKPILIKDSNRARIEKALSEEQGRATARVVSYEDIVRALTDYQESLGISKAALEDTRVDLDIHAQHFPSAYKYTPISTQISATFRYGTWRLESVERDRCGIWTIVADLSASARQALLDKHSRIKLRY